MLWHRNSLDRPQSVSVEALESIQVFWRDWADTYLMNVKNRLGFLTRNVRERWRERRKSSQTGKARRAFAAATPAERLLPIERLALLDKQFPTIAKSSGVPSADVPNKQVDRVLSLVRDSVISQQQFLEIGCGHALASASIARRGLSATAIDIAEDFDARAIDAGVRCMQMDAINLEFEDSSFDCVFSHDAFEHIPDPQTALTEALRVIRPGGYVYLSFGPLYMSARGAHSHRVLNVPYRQHLFSRDVLDTYTESVGRGRIDFQHVNRVRLDTYRQAFRNAGADRMMYLEKLNVDHLDLIQKYPREFRAAADSFDELVVSGIKVLLQKRR